MRLSKRLEMVISFIDSGGRAADVGTDHGFIPIELVRRGLAQGAIAMDVRPGPLERAAEHIRQQELEDKIETRLGDGVEKLYSGEADTVVIAGMGGQTVIHILENGRRLWDDVRHWILSPQSEIDKVRRFLCSNGFRIVREAMVEEDGKYYTVMDGVFDGEGAGTGEKLTEAEYLYGPMLIKEQNEVLMEFLGREERKLSDIVKELNRQGGEKAGERRQKLEQRLQYISEITKKEKGRDS